MPLLLLLIAVPVIEIMLLIRVAGAIGFSWTFLIVLATAVAGYYLLRREGARTLAAARSKLGRGELPSQEMTEGVMIAIGGALLLTPGFATDVFGLLCLVPFSRRWMALRFKGVLSGVVTRGFVHQSAQASRQGSSGAGYDSPTFDSHKTDGHRGRYGADSRASSARPSGRIIEGETVEDDS